MRRSIAIFLLCCFALYHFGYYVAYFSFNLQIEKNWIEKIYAENLEQGEERLLEIPMSLPYMADEEDFRTTNTQFEKDGKIYRAVKQRYFQDTLQIIYVPDSAKSALDHTIKQWISSLVQDEMPDGKSNSLLSKTFIKDYVQPDNPLEFGWIHVEQKQLIGFIFSAYDNQFLNIDTPPPESV
ncbi:hypothetical protein [Arthrospiribacter ruber]|uniref:Uncharacterized protein n=1 Tax=Arthrospiribacter ruber TaxID=2487934 RepID=A0A951IWK2_9BACT|nr:hypothetical protein [Arthrospiribacter ruber]